ncbi:MAG: carboxypeptidase-like regulatory domain-containing protein [Nitrospiraceae bacterium]
MYVHTQSRSHGLVAVSLLFCALVQTAVSGQALAYDGGTVANGASIVGTVTFSGEVPPPRRHQVKMGSNPEYCASRADAKGDVIFPEVRITPAHELSDVVVFLQEVDKGKAIPADGPSITLDRCQIQPRVVTGLLGQQLRIVSQDSILHQIRGWEAMGGKNRLPMFTAQGLSSPGSEQRVPLQIKRSSIVQLTCDQHRFMESWALVTGNPYAVVTDEQGRFQLTDIPPGTHTLGAWHPVLGYQEAKFTLSPGQTTTVTLTMTPAPPAAK